MKNRAYIMFEFGITLLLTKHYPKIIIIIK